MVMEVTIKLPESLLEYAKVQAFSSQRAVEDVLADTLEMLWLTWENLPNTHLSQPVTSLSDSEVLMLANAKIDGKQNQRIGELQAKGKMTGLTEAESYELLAMLQIYQLGQLRKSEGLAEAVRRKLKTPLPG
ncbi:MAG TPA: hypothetical protein DEG17_24130 [Cyanobacteria bacterium UBA11149]|nr:hypothetical protein [Cyanobacteria bacterium UBA11367]HBE60631.1 hypothetical protein [Cyanobacteria bacterium UBA11366]HBK63802.1 hypothetical protein [Cyanobacteria bacterium UBA11166]HBR73919.1 hypothetical protein [Cyanobacteria bacterium UBA11159]HBS72477.1 hypothetical protein [Cyanobacteria bacterium UBA11153]HBW91870.1 hypothetical protein [Cyanobacteria bacterium UBA11149]HCA96868.1 hypothetical protein [Cyanobacteria bacterium UBA9226]